MAREGTNPVLLHQEQDTAKKYQRKLNQREKKLVEAVVYSENVDEDFASALVVSAFNNVDGTAYAGIAGEVLAFSTPRAQYEVYQSAVAITAGSILSPIQSADGLELAVTAGDACELTLGTTALSPAAYVVGSFLDPDAKIYMSAKIKIDDISDVTEIFCGWRKAEAYRADPDSYDEMATFNVGKDADGQIEIHTVLNDASTTEVDTTLTDWVDDVSGTGEHTLRIEVDNSGRCVFLFDGATPTVTTTFTFDAGEVILPFIHLNSETGNPGVSIAELKIGYM